MREIGKKTIVFGTIFILITISIVPIYASDTTKDQNSQKTQSATQYILVNITASCDVIWRPTLLVKFNFNNQTEFEFPEINGTVQTNFIIVVHYKLENWVYIPRWIRVHVFIYQSGNYLWDINTTYFRVRTIKWNYNNITLNNNNRINPPVVNNTIHAQVGVSEFPVHPLIIYSPTKNFTITVGSNPKK